MKKVLLWVLLVVLVVALIVGGAGAAFYAGTTEKSLPENTATLGEVTLEPVGYDWQVPLLGGILHKPFYMAPNLSVQKIGDFTTAAPALTLPEWVTKAVLSLMAPDGTMAVEGGAQEYASYTYTQNGKYELTVKAWQQTEQLMGKAQGYTLYRASFNLALAPEVTLSADRATQGSVVAVLITGMLQDSSTAPTADTDLGNVEFHPVNGGWMGYIPITYNAEGGEHTISLQAGGQSLQAALTVMSGKASSAETTPPNEDAAAAEEYRNAIWPLYNPGVVEKLWTGNFAAPTANSAKIAYGARLTAAGQNAGTATGITYYSTPSTEVTAPQAGQVVYAGNLLLTGGTVVIDHGCGVNSYLTGLYTDSAQSGQTLAKGDVVGTVGQATALLYELRIGSKSVDPAAAIKGSSGLQYREDLG